LIQTAVELINNKPDDLCKTASVLQLEVVSWHLLEGYKKSYMISRSGFEPWTFRFKRKSATSKGPCIVKYMPITVQQVQLYTVYLYL